MTQKMINGVLMDLTPAEEQAKLDREAQKIIDKQARIDAEAAVVANKASTKTKLEALGLTVDEIKDTFNI
tara:strand:+ start:134 stop:343 length:210 start_codon:yes stop_codon:yes gene_type:complete